MKECHDRIFSNLSMQPLLKPNNTILLKFERIEDLTSNINNLLRIRIDFLNEQKKKYLEEFQKLIHDKKIVDQKPFSGVLKGEIFNSIKNEDDIPPFPPDNGHFLFPKTAEEIETKEKLKKRNMFKLS